jgi:hypothetical protein
VEEKAKEEKAKAEKGKDEKAKAEKTKEEKAKAEKAKAEKAKEEKAKEEKAKEEKAKEEKRKPLAARPVPLPADDGPKVKEPVAKPADGDGDPTALWKKGAKESKTAAQDQGPSSKPRLSRVSMDLGSVFEMPTDEEEVDVPMGLDDAPAFEEEIEPEPMSLIPVPLDPSGKKPPPPRIKAPPPKPRQLNLDRPSSGVIDFSAAMARRDEEDFDAPSDLFAPVAMPADTLADLTIEKESPREERRVSGAALAPALPALESVVHPSEPPKQSGSRGMMLGLAVAGLALVLGIGYLALRSGDDQRVATAPTATVDPSTDDTAPATATEAPAQPEAPAAEEPSVPGAGTQAPAPSVESTVAKGLAPTRPAEPAATREPRPVTTTTTTAAATAATAATPPATTTPKAAETKPKSTATVAPTETGGAPFDRSAAATSINALKGAAQGCKQPDGPQGHARVSITFAPSGRVTVATISGPPFAGTPVGGCVAATFRRASVPPFSGANVTVHTSVAIF